MRHDTAIPAELHNDAPAAVKDSLGAFWSSVFRDQDLVAALVAARVLSAGQLNIDAMEALSLRDHSGSPVLHRKHWHPLVVRLSRRNKASPLVVGMPDTPNVGPQGDSGEVYAPNETFVVGGNATYSKVNTYPIEDVDGFQVVQVATALCDSVSSPRHLLQQGRDFAISGGVLAMRKEQDPFDTDGYRIVDDGDDRFAVLWACDAAFDWDYVSDFLGYPLGLHAPSTPAASKMLSALWDTITLGLTPVSLGKVLGAAFDVPIVDHDTVVEAVAEDGDDSLVVVDDRVYRIETGRLADTVVPGAALKAGMFLTDEITVYWGLSADDVAQLRAEARLGRVALPSGSVAGVDSAVVVESVESSLQDGGWFKLSEGDSADSPFWKAVFSRTTEAERTALYDALRGANATVNPLRDMGPVVLANLILVYTTRSPVSDACSALALDFLRRLVPAYASLLLVQDIPADEAPAAGDGGVVDADGAMTMRDGVAASEIMYPADALFSSTMGGSGSEMRDEVSFMFVPSAATEV